MEGASKSNYHQRNGVEASASSAGGRKTASSLARRAALDRIDPPSQGLVIPDLDLVEVNKEQFRNLYEALHQVQIVEPAPVIPNLNLNEHPREHYGARRGCQSVSNHESTQGRTRRAPEDLRHVLNRKARLTANSRGELQHGARKEPRRTAGRDRHDSTPSLTSEMDCYEDEFGDSFMEDCEDLYDEETCVEEGRETERA